MGCPPFKPRQILRKEEPRIQAEQERIDHDSTAPETAKVNTLAQQFNVPPQRCKSCGTKGRGGEKLLLNCPCPAALQDGPQPFPTLGDALTKVESLRAEKMGWGKIAHELGFKLGPVIREARHVRKESVKPSEKKKREEQANDMAGGSGRKIERAEGREHPERVERAEHGEHLGPEKPSVMSAREHAASSGGILWVAAGSRFFSRSRRAVRKPNPPTRRAWDVSVESGDYGRDLILRLSISLYFKRLWDWRRSRLIVPLRPSGQRGKSQLAMPTRSARMERVTHPQQSDDERAGRCDRKRKYYGWKSRNLFLRLPVGARQIPHRRQGQKSGAQANLMRDWAWNC